MSLTTLFDEPEIPAWVKERLESWHTQLFTGLDLVDYYSPSRRQDILKRFNRSFSAFASHCVRRYRQLPALSVLARVAGGLEDKPLDFAFVYLAFKRLYPEFESYYASRFQALVPSLTTDPVASFLLGLTETIPSEFAKGYPPPVSLRIALANAVRLPESEWHTPGRPVWPLVVALRDYTGPCPHLKPAIKEIRHALQVFHSRTYWPKRTLIESVLYFSSTTLARAVVKPYLRRSLFENYYYAAPSVLTLLDRPDTWKTIEQYLGAFRFDKLNTLLEQRFKFLFFSHTDDEDVEIRPLFTVPKFHATNRSYPSPFVFLTPENYQCLQKLAKGAVPSWTMGKKGEVLRAFKENPTLFHALNTALFSSLVECFGQELVRLCIASKAWKPLICAENPLWKSLTWKEVIPYGITPQIFSQHFFGAIAQSEDAAFVTLAAATNVPCLKAFVKDIDTARLSSLYRSFPDYASLAFRCLWRLAPQNHKPWKEVSWQALVRAGAPTWVLKKSGVAKLKKEAPTDALLRMAQESDAVTHRAAVRLLLCVVAHEALRRTWLSDFYATPAWEGLSQRIKQRILGPTLARDLSQSTTYCGPETERATYLKHRIEATGCPAPEKTALVVSYVKTGKVTDSTFFSGLSDALKAGILEKLGPDYVSLFVSGAWKKVSGVIEQFRINAMDRQTYIRYRSELKARGKKALIKSRITAEETPLFTLINGAFGDVSHNDVLKVVRTLEPECQVRLLESILTENSEILSEDYRNILQLEIVRLTKTSELFFAESTRRMQDGKALVVPPAYITRFDVGVGVLSYRHNLHELCALAQEVGEALFAEGYAVAKPYLETLSGNDAAWLEIVRCLGWDVTSALRHVISCTNWKAPHGHKYDDCYITWELAKKHGGTRTISTPAKSLKCIQRRIYEAILAPCPVHPAAFGFVPGRSIADNARGHVGQAFVVNVDVHNCFPSVKYPVVAATLKRELKGKLSAKAIGLISEICTADGGLPIGSAASPVILNLVLKRTDEILSAAAEHLDCSYSRYADDLTFSGEHNAVKLIGIAKSTLERIGLTLDEKKTNIFRRGRRQSCTGLVVNEKVNVNRVYLRKLRAAVHTLCLGKEPTWDGRPDSVAAVLGRIHFVNAVRPEKARELTELLRRAGVSL